MSRSLAAGLLSSHEERRPVTFDGLLGRTKSGDLREVVLTEIFSVLDIFATPGQRHAKETLDSNDVVIARLDADVDRGLKAKKIKIDTRDSLGFRWKLFDTEWGRYRISVLGPGGTGISTLNADVVQTNADQFRARADAFAKEIVSAMGGDVTPLPPKPDEPPPLIPPGATSGLVVGTVLAGVGVVVLGALYLKR